MFDSGRLKVRLLRLTILIGLLVTVGCGDAPTVNFRLNAVYVKQQENTIREEIKTAQLQDVVDSLAALFGTPDDPRIVSDAEVPTDEILDVNKLRLAAGPVKNNREGASLGLYRRHCVHCHGITGDGAGPTAAFLNPYPRDYRRGIFKFKSTPIGARPTDEDLKRTLIEGIPGTAMPSFRLLDGDEIEALIQYVKYLSIRGEVERALIEDVSELAEDESLDTSPENLVQDRLSLVVSRWKRAPEQVTQVAAKPDWSKKWPDLTVEERHTESISVGRELFYGALANCIKCHGISQLGDGVTNDWDHWFKELEPDKLKPEQLSEFMSLGLLKPRPIIPRNLRQGIFRGGRRPVDIFLRLYNGIDGAPMPALPKKPPGQPNAPGLTDDDIWHLVDYVQSLQYESISVPRDHVMTNQRLRN